MKEVRYLIRLSNKGFCQPADQSALLAKVRSLAAPLKGKAINLRVSTVAIEFDLFCAAEADRRPFQEALRSVGEVITWRRLDGAPVPHPAQKVVDEARQFFNEQRFWEVHEVLEGLWLERTGTEKGLLQGLILVAAALVHAQKNEMPVAWTMLEDALRRLQDRGPGYYGWDIAKFRDYFTAVLAAKILTIPSV